MLEEATLLLRCVQVINAFTNDIPLKIAFFGTRNLTASYRQCIKHMVMKWAEIVRPSHSLTPGKESTSFRQRNWWRDGEDVFACETRSRGGEGTLGYKRQRLGQWKHVKGAGAE